MCHLVFLVPGMKCDTWLFPIPKMSVSVISVVNNCHSGAFHFCYQGGNISGSTCVLYCALLVVAWATAAVAPSMVGARYELYERSIAYGVAEVS